MNKCNNCGKSWHVYKQCKLPIVSIGLINVNEKKEYLMICRKKSLGYVDFLCGKYSLSSILHVMNLIDEMTMQEKKHLLEKTFYELWEDLWCTKPDGSSEELNAQEKFMMIKNGCMICNQWATLQTCIEDSKTSWKEPEWGFPKGRKNHYETDLLCAYREYEEETGYDRKDLLLIKNIVPYEEIFIGSNYKSYKHKYFVAKSNQSLQKRPYQTTEVSDMKWFTYEEAMMAIRPYNIERKQILTMIHSMLDEYIVL
jgi:8-oxo-dGTP pyrophosphatase MutT (NUDIX family)